jgi:hypothetical protein
MRMWKPARKSEPDKKRANVFMRRDALLYQAMVDRALSHSTDPNDWSWDANGKGIWIPREWLTRA